jgi:cation:H+ antiporter
METAIQIIAGLALLALGGEGVVRGAVGVARRLGVSELLIGLTLVGFGTSTPELLTSINAAIAGSPGIAIGNVVGSNIGNILLIFAIVILIRPVAIDAKSIARDSAVMIAVSALLIAIAVFVGELSRWVGALFFLGLIAYIVVAFMSERKTVPSATMQPPETITEPKAKLDPLPVSLAFAFGGLVALIFGADFLVKGAITLAEAAGMSQTVIGLTIVAVGTSLPELVASLAAALKGRSDVAVGNIIGSNIYNILGILGLTALIAPVAVPPDMIARDWIAMGGAAVLMVALAYAFGKFGRLTGLLFLAIYGVYTYFLLQGTQLPR